MKPVALDGFRLRGEVDWIEVMITLPSPSQFRHVQDRLEPSFGKVFVKPIDGDHSSRRFSFKVQNPAGAYQFIRDVQAVVRPGDPPITPADVEIIGIEVAVDGYIRGSDRVILAAATGHFVRHLAHRPAGHPRATSPRHFRVPCTFRDLLHVIEDGASINMGDADSDFRVRAYLKDYDTIDGRRCSLPSVQQRARIEVTLSGNQLPFRTLEGWANFQFEKLSRQRFAMCKPIGTGDVKRMQERALQLGRAEDAYKIRPSARRKRSPGTRKDQATNDKIRQALRGLTKRQSCRNSVHQPTSVTVATEGSTNFSPPVLNTLIQQSHSPTQQPQSCLTNFKAKPIKVEANNALESSIDESNEKGFEYPLPESWGAW